METALLLKEHRLSININKKRLIGNIATIEARGRNMVEGSTTASNGFNHDKKQIYLQKRKIQKSRVESVMRVI